MSTIHSLLAEMQKAAGLESMNPSTSHESGGKPDNVADVTTGQIFAEQSAADKDRPGATAEDNKVTGKTPDEPATVASTTAATGEDPENEKNVTGDIKDPNSTSHPANGNIGEKYSADDYLSKAADTINTLVNESKNRMAQLAKQAAEGTTAPAVTNDPAPSKSAGEGEKAGMEKLSEAELTKNAELVAQIKEATGNEALAEFYRDRSAAEVDHLMKQAYAYIVDARQQGDALASLLADQYDHEKAAASRKPAPGNNNVAASFYAQLKKAMEEEEMEEAPAEEAPMEDPSAGGGGDEEAAMMAAMGAGGGMEGGEMVSPEEMGGAGAEQMGGEMIDPETMAMLEQIAQQEGVSVEELIMALASKSASVAVRQQKAAATVKIDKKSESYQKLDRLCKDALAAVSDIVDRGKRK